MKTGEARGIYGAQLMAYNEQKVILSQKKKALEDKVKHTENGAAVYANEAAALELTYQAVSEKQDEYQNYMDKLMGQRSAEINRINSEQQADAIKEYGDEMGKILTVARRIMDGDIVPPSDERKLIEFNPELYQMAKNIGMMKQIEERKKHDSLWEDEAPKENVDSAAEADGQEVFFEGPEIVSVGETMAAAVSEISSAEG